MTWAGYPLWLVVCVGVVGCGRTAGTAPSSPSIVDPADPKELCVGRGADLFREFCRTHGSDPELTKRMTDVIVSAGVEPGHFRLRCRADICAVKCKTSPRTACVEALGRVTQWSGYQRDLFDAVAVSPRRGYSVYRFVSKESLTGLPARRAVLDQIARRLHDSPTLAECKQNATAHGLLLLYIDVPVSGSPTVMVDGEVAWTADADCVSKAVLATVIDEQITPPFSNRDIPITVQL